MTRYINEYTIALLINKAIVNGINTDEEQDMLVDDVNRFIEYSITCLNYDDGHQIDCDIYYDSEFIKNIDKELNNFGIKAKRLL